MNDSVVQEAGYVDSETQSKANECDKALRWLLNKQTKINGPIVVGATLLLLAAEFCETAAPSQSDDAVKKKFSNIAEAVYQIIQRRPNAN